MALAPAGARASFIFVLLGVGVSLTADNRLRRILLKPAICLRQLAQQES
jgi:hypothetical protein